MKREKLAIVQQPPRRPGVIQEAADESLDNIVHVNDTLSLFIPLTKKKVAHHAQSIALMCSERSKAQRTDTHDLGMCESA